MPGDVKVGIIGPGAIGGVHAEALAQIGNPAVAVAGPKPDELSEFAARYDVPRTFASSEDLLDDVDAVVVATPSHLHSSLTLQALRAGKHVLTEIPVGMSLAEAESVARTAESSGLVAAVGHTLRYWAPHRDVVRRLADGPPPTHVIVRSLMLRQTDFGWTGKKRDWTDNVLWHHGAHAVDAALWLLGDTDVTVQAAVGADWPGSGRQMDVSAVLETWDRRIASVSLSYHSRRSLSDFVVVTEEASFEIRDGRVLGDEDGEDTVLFDGGGIAAVQDAAVAAQDAEFLSAVREHRAPSYSAADALPAMRVLQEIELVRAGRDARGTKEQRAQGWP